MKNNYLLTFGFIVLVVIIPVLGMITPDREVSLVENRNLQTFPILSENNKESFTENFDNYLVDQFPFRDRIINFYTRMQLLKRNTSVRDAIIIEDWLFTRDYPVKEEELEKAAQAIEKTIGRNRDIDFYYLIFPSKYAMLSELHPKFLNSSISGNNNKMVTERLESIEGLRLVNILNKLLDHPAQERQAYYYRTDFHWNSQGSLKAFEILTEEIWGEKVLEEALARFEKLELKDRYFKGDLEKRFSGNITNTDLVTINQVIDDSQLGYYKSIDNSKEVSRGKIVAANIDKKSVDYNDIYTTNLSLLRIVNKKPILEKKALVFKDSYFNAMVDPMTTIFEELIIIDPRYYKENYDYSHILNNKKLDYIFFAYHQSNIDKQLPYFLEGN